jgi:hypothetical protein
MDRSVDEPLKQRKEKLEFKKEDFDNNSIYLRSTERFRDKLTMMRDLLVTYGDSGPIPQLEKIENPFVD